MPRLPPRRPSPLSFRSPRRSISLPRRWSVSLSQMIAVEIGSLVTAMAPREGWAPPIEVASAPALKLSSVQLTGQRHAISFEPLAAELKAVQHAQAHAVMVVEGQNQAARLRRHLEAYDIEVNTRLQNFPRAARTRGFSSRDYRGRDFIRRGPRIRRALCLLARRKFSASRARIARVKPRAKGAALLNLEELRPGDHVVHHRSWNRRSTAASST